MTSSLVGSEMCIRDSPWKLYPLFPAKPLYFCSHADFAHEATTQGQLPVSYTHLTLPTICSV
eukprot:1216802-Prorocentrum_lima.AAC.1